MAAVHFSEMSFWCPESFYLEWMLNCFKYFPFFLFLYGSGWPHWPLWTPRPIFSTWQKLRTPSEFPLLCCGLETLPEGSKTIVGLTSLFPLSGFTVMCNLVHCLKIVLACIFFLFFSCSMWEDKSRPCYYLSIKYWCHPVYLQKTYLLPISSLQLFLQTNRQPMNLQMFHVLSLCLFILCFLCQLCLSLHLYKPLILEDKVQLLYPPRNLTCLSIKMKFLLYAPHCFVVITIISVLTCFCQQIVAIWDQDLFHSLLTLPLSSS